MALCLGTLLLMARDRSRGASVLKAWIWRGYPNPLEGAVGEAVRGSQADRIRRIDCSTDIQILGHISLEPPLLRARKLDLVGARPDPLKRYVNHIAVLEPHWRVFPHPHTLGAGGDGQRTPVPRKA